MESLYLLIPMSVAAVFGIVLCLWWATSGGQFDDLEAPGQRILMDDDEPPATGGELRRTPGHLININTAFAADANMTPVSEKNVKEPKHAG